jgi:diguanylate cyclase (GGDEF)-like protein
MLRWFHYNQSVGLKLTAALGFISALAIAVGLHGLIQLRTANDVTREIRERHFTHIEALLRVKQTAYEHFLLATRWVQSGLSESLPEVTVGVMRAETTVSTVERAYVNSADAEERRAFSAFSLRWEEYLQTLRAALKQRHEGSEALAQIEFKADVTFAFEKATDVLESLSIAARDRSQMAAARAEERFQLALWLTIGAIILTTACALIVVSWMRRSVLSPILCVTEAMRRLTAGEEAVQLPQAFDANDEIGTLVEAASGYRDALIASRNFAAAAETEQERLQAAVSNMPVGLCMFDASGRLIICNEAYAEIYSLPPELLVPGTHLTDIIRSRIEAGMFPAAGPEAYEAEISAMVASRVRAATVLQLRDGRTISTSLQPMAGGGWVGVHEDVTERRRAEERIAYMAHHDALTGLPNRTLFQERVVDELKHLQQSETVAVMCLDLDRFKAVNDTLGHPMGDALLKIVAERLKACVREGDIVARFGGDEFAIIQVGAEQPQSATTIARRIIEAVSAPYSIGGQQINIGVSVGIALAPTDGLEPGILLKNADMALYRAKGDGRGTFHFFEPIMDARMQARRRLELDLRKALLENEFELFYQPIVDVASNRVTSFEALLRWRHPDKGLISPADFIPLAEEIGLIVPLGEWALRQACLDAASWPDGLKVSVNLSPVQFRNATLLETIRTALRDAKLAAERLEVEITEGVLLAETEATIAILNQLHALGVRIAMDDFGTGYSSLSYFRSFRFDRVKIDRSFISNLGADDSSLAIIRAVAGLSASLGIATTAEGVETQEQLERLRAEGCREIQGYLFSPPRPAREIPHLLATLNRSGAAA